MGNIVRPNSVGDALWRQNLAQHVIDHQETRHKVREAALLVKTPESCELYCRRAKGFAVTNRAVLDILDSIQTVLDWAREQGWVEDVN